MAGKKQKKEPVTVELSEKLGNGFVMGISIDPEMSGNISWRAIISGKDGIIAVFVKPLNRDGFRAVVNGREIANDNGVMATYQDWKKEAENATGVSISWLPQGRAMWKLEI